MSLADSPPSSPTLLKQTLRLGIALPDKAKKSPQMAIESAPQLVKILAEELQRSGTKPRKFAKITGIGEDRLELLQTGAWEDLTIREIVAISDSLDVDLTDL